MVTLYFRGEMRQRDQSLLQFKQPLPVPPPEWIHNASCYTPRLLNDDDALMKYTVSVADVSKVQGDPSGCAKPPVDIKTKVLLWPGLSWPGQAKSQSQSQSETFVLKQTGGFAQRDGSPFSVGWSSSQI